MKTERRWLKSVLAASLDPQPALPWQRSTRRRPAALQQAAAPVPRPQVVRRPTAMAAH